MPTFQCRKCKAEGAQLDVAGAGNTRKVDGRKRNVQHVRCTSCGHEWWSRHPMALQRGREADKQGAPA